jgi:hypothetical protein
MFFGKLKSQDLPFVLQFDKPIYTTGETAWFAVIRTDSAQFLDVQEVLHFELVSPRNIKVITGKISFAERIAEGYLNLPNDLEEGYYRFRAFTLKDLNDGGYYIYADIPVYNEWKENLTVFKYEDELIEDVEDDPDIQEDRKKMFFSRRDTVEYSELINVREDSYYSVRIQPREFRKFPPIQPALKRITQTIEINSDLEREDSLYFEAFLSEMESGQGVTSPMISIYSVENQIFFRSSAKDGWLSLKLPNYNGEFTLQIFNLNPYQETVSNLQVKQWTINEGYSNPAKPPLTKEIADYLIKAKHRRKISDLFSEERPSNKFLVEDTVRVIPDRAYMMSDYRYINNLQEFIYEAVPGARFEEMDDGSQSVRLFNPERNSIFVDRPWYIVDGYLTNHEEMVLKIPFNDIDEIRLYVDTNTIKDHFEYFLWRNGILEVKTNDIRYLRNLKSDPNSTDFMGFLPEMKFVESLGISPNSNDPDFRTTMYWDSGKWSDNYEGFFTLSDDTGRFIYEVIEISASGEIMRREGEFEIR